MVLPEKTGGTVGKALNVLDKVASFERPVRFTEILRESEHPKATLYRLLQTLTNQGMLTFDPERQTYSVGIRLVRLAHTAWRHSSLGPVARPYIDALADQVGEAVHLAQIDNGHVLFVDKRKTSDMFETLAHAGKVAPCYCTGVGKAMLAFMDTARCEQVMRRQVFLANTPSTHTRPETLRQELEVIRKEGVAFDREEHEQGIISIAAPIVPDGSQVIGAISIATSTSQRSLEELNAFRPALLDTVAKVGAEAASWQFP